MGKRWQIIDNYDECRSIIIWDGDEQASDSICDWNDLGDGDFKEVWENANLIASAPELLEELKLAVKELKAVYSFGATTKIIERWERLIKKIEDCEY